MLLIRYRFKKTSNAVIAFATVFAVGMNATLARIAVQEPPANRTLFALLFGVVAWNFLPAIFFAIGWLLRAEGK
jgi:hypothetical protein